MIFRYETQMFPQLRTIWTKRSFGVSLFGTMMKANHKPPNILVKTEDEQEFMAISRMLATLIDADRYTLYQLSHPQFMKCLWLETCCLLMYNVDGGEPKQGECLDIFKDYVIRCNGNVLFYSLRDEVYFEFANFLNAVKLGSSNDDTSTTRKVVFQKSLLSSSSDLLFRLKMLGINCNDVGAQTTTQSPAYFISFDNMKHDQIFQLNGDDTNCIIGKDTRLTFCHTLKEHAQAELKNNDLLIITGDELKSNLFQPDLYKSKLKTKNYGRNMIYTDTINSTQTVFTGVNFNSVKYNGLIVHANRQLKGKGRSGNQWLSPPGCMMFSMQIHIPINSLLGQKISILQHLVVVAFVRSIKTRRGFETLQLNLKWPNDIYIHRRTKIGGVIINSACMQSTFKVTIGLGVNVDNEKPTECLNSLIRQHNTTSSCHHLSELKMEDVLAETVNNIEHLVDTFQQNGVEDFKGVYYDCWLHSGSEVTIESRNHESAVVCGIDDFGFLKVKMKSTGEEVLLQPDGNSFDMMKNMIVLKK